ncbi:MAG: membrane integrity-associated transporter subunit PqiC, partial [Deltaproteobacteria bacterium]
MKNRFSLGWASFFLVSIIVSCSSTPATQFYKLNSLPSTQQENPAALPGMDIAIGVGPVELPEFLDRPQIVTRKSQNQLEISEFHRWAASFPRDFSRVLAKNISTLVPTDRVAVYPWEDTFSPTYQIKLDVEQFDGQLGERVFLRAIWAVVGQEG